MINKNKETSKGKKESLLSYRALLKKRKPNFLRHKWSSASRLGMGRKNKQKWRKPKGRHSKLREKRKNRGKQPSIGFRSPRLVRGTLAGMKPFVVRNVHDLENAGQAVKSGSAIAFLASVGMKKRIEIARRASEMNIDFANFNPKGFLKEAEKELAARKDERKAREERMKQRIEKPKKGTEKKKPETKEAASSGLAEEKPEEKEIIKPKSEKQQEKTAAEKEIK